MGGAHRAQPPNCRGPPARPPLGAPGLGPRSQRRARCPSDNLHFLEAITTRRGARQAPCGGKAVARAMSVPVINLPQVQARDPAKRRRRRGANRRARRFHMPGTASPGGIAAHGPSPWARPGARAANPGRPPHCCRRASATGTTAAPHTTGRITGTSTRVGGGSRQLGGRGLDASRMHSCMDLHGRAPHPPGAAAWPKPESARRQCGTAQKRLGGCWWEQFPTAPKPLHPARRPGLLPTTNPGANAARTRRQLPVWLPR